MDKKTKKFTFLKERKMIERLDVLPFLILQSICMVFYTQENLHHLIKIGICSILVLAQLISFFCKFWSENLLAKICYKLHDTIDGATHIRVDVKSEKFKIINKTIICEIKRYTLAKPSDIAPDSKLTIIDFEKIMHYYDYNTLEFIKSKAPLHKPLGDFLKSTPHKSEEEISALRLKFGENKMKIPIPSFFSLYKEHMVAPFFVFQLFCILLWVFDDYGLNSFFTLSMLCIFEATVVGQRIISLVTLRKMRVPPHQIYVYRMDQWIKISSNELLPGDIVSVLDGNNYVICEEAVDPEESSNLISKFLNKLKELKKHQEVLKNKRDGKVVTAKLKDKEPSPLTCDMLLLSGSAIVNEAMLTGESVPQIKDSIKKHDDKFNKQFDMKVSHKNCVLFAGTKVVKVTPGSEQNEDLPENVKSSPPDRGAICVVLKTGFATSQGKLLRTVMYSKERAQGDSKEAFVFIFVLLAVALCASYYVLLEGIEREGEVTYKLILRCIIIITSVVPAELPIELSLAINTSLLFLQSKRIVCIEPFRIPFAGKIDVCCFDKTGTLTKDEFIMKGVAKSVTESPLTALQCDEDTASILLGCHSLLKIQNKVVGDPVELAVFKASGGSFSDHDSITSHRKCKILPIRRYPFDSNLKRMSVLVRFHSGNFSNVQYNRVLTKGAPEVIKGLLKDCPDDYDMTYHHYAKKGYRILALAYSDNPTFNINTKREEVEKNLIFCGFVIVETPLKKNTEKYISELLDAKLEVAIITGDHHLTTAKVANDLKIGPNEIYFMKITDSKVQWVDLDGCFMSNSPDITAVRKLAKNYMLGITGKEMEKLDLLTFDSKDELFTLIKLFCRVSPTQKDDIVKHILKAGKNPSMCGDGSNDVGALKRAVIGVALLNSEETAKQKEQPFSVLSLDDGEGEIKSGDVTAAAPFTSKSGSIRCIRNIFIQGRCTLVITFQMFKILASNCLLSAYTLSVLALRGVKFSDYQSTYMGFVVAFFFMMLAKAEPLKRLNDNKPPYTIFSFSSILSVLGQALTHLGSLFLILHITELFDPVGYSFVKSLDDEFTPTLMNSIVFIYSALNQTINFVVNYQGEPFMKNMTTNKWQMRLCLGVCAASFVVIFDLHPQLNEALELVPFPEDIMYKLSFVGIMFIDFVVCYVLENWKKIFGVYKEIKEEKSKKKNRV